MAIAREASSGPVVLSLLLTAGVVVPAVLCMCLTPCMNLNAAARSLRPAADVVAFAFPVADAAVSRPCCSLGCCCNCCFRRWWWLGCLRRARKALRSMRAEENTSGSALMGWRMLERPTERAAQEDRMSDNDRRTESDFSNCETRSVLGDFG